MYSYEGAGEFDFKGKMRRSIIENLLFYLIAILVFIGIFFKYVVYGEFNRFLLLFLQVFRKICLI